MAITTALFSTEEYEICTLCSSKHNRTRPSFCQCKHCSIPLCLNCMKEHHDELLQNVAEISHQYNELQDLLEKKQNMIIEGTTTSIEDVNRYFETYINELCQTKQNIITNIENTKQNAQKFLSEVGSNLQTMGTVIQALGKENAVWPAKLDHLLIELEKVKQKIHIFRTKRTENLTKTVPEFTLEFECLSVSASDTPQPVVIEKTTDVQPEIKNSASQAPKPIKLVRFAKLPVTQLPVPFDRRRDDDEDSWVSHDNDYNKNDKHACISTKFVVDRMASNGKCVLYASYFDEQHDVIAYCFMNDNSNREDRYRDWKQARIEDIIWWEKINQFVCATENAIYTVSFANTKFKFLCVLRGNWSFIRIAANSNHLFVKCITTNPNTNQILVYTSNFQVANVFNADTHKCLDTAKSFCVTDQILASICTRFQNKRKVFQVTFFDLNMKQLKWIRLGRCDESIEIRSDGKDWFFITTGRRQLHIVSRNGQKNTVDLENNSDCIAVLDNRRVAISSARSDMELVIY